MMTPEQIELAEAWTLGSMIVSRTACDTVLDKLCKEDFATEPHAVIFNTIKELHDNGSTVDSITLLHKLNEDGLVDAAGGRSAIHTLAATVPAVANAHDYAEIVRTHHAPR